MLPAYLLRPDGRAWPKICVIMAALALPGCGGADDAELTQSASVAARDIRVVPFADLESEDERAPQIRQFCGSCHAVPLPQSFPKDAWYEEVRRGFDFYHQSGRSDLTMPVPQDVTDFYRKYAPVEFEIPDWPDDSSTDVTFAAQPVTVTWPSIKTPPAVSFVDVRKAAEDAREIWFSDMRSGAAGQLAVEKRPASGADTSAPPMRISVNRVANHPVAIRPADLDGNGIDDLIFTELGSFLPEDHDKGRLVRLPDGTGASPGTAEVLLEGLGRIADVCIEDFTGDGLLDMVVAEFGWRKTGGIHLLTNAGLTDGQPTFSHQVLDDRPGTINIIPYDVDANGTLDFVASISQEHEQIVAFLNEPDGFRSKILYAAPDPSWGTSGAALVDLDQDGDQDILYTNGDTFDSYLVKPYHGIWWLENDGAWNFTERRVAAMPGVHRALAEDIDGDGDLDIVAAALLPTTSSRNYDPDNLQGLIWLEQTQPGRFARHVIERGRPIYPAMTIADLDADGRPDIIAGCFHEDGDETQPLLKVFWNTTATKVAGRE